MKQKLSDLREDQDEKFNGFNKKLRDQDQRLDEFEFNVSAKLEKYRDEYKSGYNAFEL